MQPAAQKHITIIVPAWNEEHHIAECLVSLDRLRYPSFEVIVINDGSSDATLEIADGIAETDHRVKVISLGARMGVSHAMNVGASKAKGDLLVFIGADCVVAEEWLLEMIKGMERYGASCATGPVRSIPGELSSWQRTNREFQLSWERANIRDGYTLFIHGGNFAIDKDLFDNLGGFDENLPSKEDRDLYIRIIQSGVRIPFIEKAIVRHAVEETLAGYFHQSAWYAWGTMFLTRKYKRCGTAGFIRELSGLRELLLTILGFAVLVVFLLLTLVGATQYMLLWVSLFVLGLGSWRDVKGFVRILKGDHAPRAWVLGLIRHAGERYGYLTIILQKGKYSYH